MSQQQQQHSSSLKEDEEENSSSSSSHKKDAIQHQKPQATTTSKYSLDAEDLENKNYVKSILFSSSSSPSTNNNNNVKSVAKTTKTSPNQFSQVSFNLSLSPHNESLDKLTRSYMAKNAMENISNIDEDLLVDKSFMFQGGNQEEEEEEEEEEEPNENNDDDESKLVQEEEEEENLLLSKTNSPLNKTNREENLNEEDDDDFKLFARNENYKEKYITKSSQQQGLPPLPINNQYQKQQSNESRLDDSLYDVMSIGNQTPFKFDMLSSGSGGGGNGGNGDNQFYDFTHGN